MVKENIGIFAADHESSNLIEWVSVDMQEAESFPFVLGVISDRLKKDKILPGEAYLHFADGETIRRESELDGYELYDIDPEELENETGLPSFSEASDPNYRGFVSLVLKGYDGNYGFGLTSAYVKDVRTTVKEALADKVKKEEANHGITAGTAVYLRKPDTRASELRTTPFDPARHDARKVLEASKVANKPLGELELYPMPPSKSKHEPKFWGHFKNTAASKVHFTGATQRDIKLKAAVYEAWEKIFEGK